MKKENFGFGKLSKESELAIRMLREGELDFIFYSKDPDEKPKEDFGEMPF